jgi:hypothetical protein
MSDAADIAKSVQTALSQRFPGFRISGARLEQINADSPKHHALDFWLAHSTIWDIPFTAFPFLEEGKPTAAFGRFEGLYRGTIDQGISLKPWPKDDPGKLEPKGNGDGDDTILWVAGGAIVFWLVYRAQEEKGAA